MAGTRITLASLAIVLIFAGCSNPVGSEMGSQSATPPGINFRALYDTLTEASPYIEDDNVAAAVAASQGMYTLVLFAGYVDFYYGLSSYTLYPQTVTVTEVGGLWTCTTTIDNGIDPAQTTEYIVEKTISGWDFSWIINGVTYLAGSISGDGYTAQVDIFDVDNAPNKQFSFSSQPYSGAYDLEITSTNYSSGIAESTIVVYTDKSGARGQWNYDTDSNGTYDHSGFWPTIL